MSGERNTKSPCLSDIMKVIDTSNLKVMKGSISAVGTISSKSELGARGSKGLGFADPDSLMSTHRTPPSSELGHDISSSGGYVSNQKLWFRFHVCVSVMGLLHEVYFKTTLEAWSGPLGMSAQAGLLLRNHQRLDSNRPMRNSRVLSLVSAMLVEAISRLARVVDRS